MSGPQIGDVDIFGNVKTPFKGVLAERFIVPPFSVMDARKGDWQERKAGWLRMGVRGEHARGVEGTTLVRPIQIGNDNFYQEKTELERRLGRTLSTPEAQRILEEEGRFKPVEKTKKDLNLGGSGETPMDRLAKYSGKDTPDDSAEYSSSHFDPVLCELMYKWFCPPGGVVSDPFAGSSVSGMVAAHLGFRFWGMDLSADQVACNRKVIATLPADRPRPEWVHGNSAEDYAARAPEVDFGFTCPPYFDLEVYSEDPGDLSHMDWDGFRDAYDRVVRNLCSRLKADRFIGVVIGDVRDGDGNWRDLPAFTTRLFRRHGLHLYNEGFLLTPVGSLSVRTGRQFEMTRKLGKAHQQVFVYLKGDAKRATDAVTGIEYEERRRRYDESVKKRTAGWKEEGD
jgi:hypothetical protein